MRINPDSWSLEKLEHTIALGAVNIGKKIEAFARNSPFVPNVHDDELEVRLQPAFPSFRSLISENNVTPFGGADAMVFLTGATGASTKPPLTRPVSSVVG